MSVQSPGYPGLCCFCSIFPAALRLDGLLVVGPVGFPGGAAPGRATGWCGLWGFPAALRLDGLLWWGLWDFPAALRLDWLLMVRPSGFPAVLRLAGLLVVRAVGFPGGAALGRATGWWCGLWDG
ncbi:TPA: hypothetical protein SLP42_001701 [Klebsiella aerogenes]|nr:hypothetical protein [Klebsiella aerogenes]